MISYIQAIILGIFQGVTELFPVSSLGHSVLLANLFHWTNLASQETAKTSTFINLLIMMHVATAVGLVIFYWQIWVRIIKGFFRSLTTRQLKGDSDAKLAWLLIVATIPAGIMGLLFQHVLQKMFATAFFAIVFIMINGVLLIKGDKLVTRTERAHARRRTVASRSAAATAASADEMAVEATAEMVSDKLTLKRAVLIGCAQVGALLAGISRSGITMLAGLRSGLEHQDAARFSFLLTTPIIFGAGIYKLPSVLHTHNGSLGPILLGSLLAGIGAYVSARYLDKYFQTRSLKPFGWYCIWAGVFMIAVNLVRAVI